MLILMSFPPPFYAPHLPMLTDLAVTPNKHRHPCVWLPCPSLPIPRAPPTLPPPPPYLPPPPAHSIRPDSSQLTDLTALYLGINEANTTLPNEWSALINLRALSAQAQRIQGTLPKVGVGRCGEGRREAGWGGEGVSGGRGAEGGTTGPLPMSGAL